MRFILLSVVSLSALVMLGCAPSATGEPSVVVPADSFTTAAIAKTWTSNCMAATEPIFGGDHTKTSLVLGAGGSFSYVIYWYTGSACTPPYSATYQGYGNFTLSGYNTGSTTNKTLTFTFDFVNYSTYLQSTGASVRTAFNTDCGGTSPYNGGANSTDGTSVQTKTMTCAHENFPNTGARSVFANTATLSNGVLSLGAYSDANIPGTFNGGALPTSTSISFN